MFTKYFIIFVYGKYIAYKRYTNNLVFSFNFEMTIQKIVGIWFFSEGSANITIYKIAKAVR